MKKDPFAKDGYKYVFDYYYGVPKYYTIEEYEKLKAEEEKTKIDNKIHLLEGYIIALNNKELVINTISNSNNISEAKENLLELLHLSEKQINAILQMKLSKFLTLDNNKIIEEIKKLKGVS